MSAGIVDGTSGWGGIVLRHEIDEHSAELDIPPSTALKLVLVTEGSYVIESARAHGSWETALLAPGRSAATPPGREIRARWTADSDETFRSTHLEVPDVVVSDVAGSFDRATPRLDYLSRDDELVRVTMLELDRAARMSAPALFAESLTISLVAHLLSLPTSRQHPSSTSLSAPELTRVVDYVHAHLEGPLTLEVLAGLVHVSMYHFLRSFAGSTGETPMRFVTRARMDRAEQMLASGTASVGAIATACGYASAAAFAAAFRRHRGATPLQFRRNR